MSRQRSLQRKQFDYTRQRTERFLRKKIFTDAPRPQVLDSFLGNLTAEISAEPQAANAAIDWFRRRPEAKHYFSRINPSQEEWIAGMMRLGFSMTQAYAFVGIISTALYAQHA